MGMYPCTCHCGKPFMWFSGNKIQLCEDCAKTAVVTQVTMEQSTEVSEPKITEVTLAWARIRVLMEEANSKLFEASMIAHKELKNEDLHKEIYKFRVDQQFTMMKIGNALGRNKASSSPWYMTVSDIEKELQKKS